MSSLYTGNENLYKNINTGEFQNINIYDNVNEERVVKYLITKIPGYISMKTYPFSNSG